MKIKGFVVEPYTGVAVEEALVSLLRKGAYPEVTHPSYDLIDAVWSGANGAWEFTIPEDDPRGYVVQIQILGEAGEPLRTLSQFY